MKCIFFLIACSFSLLSFNSVASTNSVRDISHLISKEEFNRFTDVADFIDQSPQVSIMVTPSQQDIEKYGQHEKMLTGSDCDRDGKMDDNATCNAVFFKLWMKYAR